jgi:hypothetical protein
MSNPSAYRSKPREWLWVALPPALMGLVMAALLLISVPVPGIVWGGATPLSAFRRLALTWPIGAMLGAVLAAGAVLGAWRGLPRWSHTWTTSAIVSVALGLMILADDVEYLISPLADTLVALVLLVLLALLALLAARRSRREAALVGMGFAAAFALVVTFSAVAGPMLRVDVALRAAPAGLAYAFLLVTFVRGRGPAPGLALAGTTALSVALLWQYRGVVATALGPPYDLTFLRVLLSITAIGLMAPLVLAWFATRWRLAGAT